MKNMRRLLPVFLAGFSVASALIFFFGDSGLTAYRKLDGYRQSLWENVQELQTRNTGLNQELASLRDDPQRSLVMARKIGLYRSGEEVVKLEGYKHSHDSYEVGDMVKLRKSGSARNVLFKATGLTISCFLAAFAVFANRTARRRGREV